MDSDTEKIVAGLSDDKALKFVCLFLSQNDEPSPPHVELGFTSQAEAFEGIAEKFLTRPNTVKNERDAFDRYTNSSRAGWNKVLPPRLSPVFEEFGALQREKMRDISRAILEARRVVTMNELEDLPAIREELEQRLSKFSVDAELKIGEALWRDIAKAYEDSMSSDRVTIVANHAMRIETKTGLYAYISSQELRQIWACLPYCRALHGYSDAYRSIIAELDHNSKQGKELFKKLPGREELGDEEKERLESIIDTLFSEQSDRENLRKFFFDKSWAGLSKTLERTDWMSSAIVSHGGWVNVAADRRGDLTEALSKDPAFEKRLHRVLEAATTGPIVTGEAIKRRTDGGNHVFYGAPGTGKSYAIASKIKTLGAREVKTVFHPDVQNSDFVGTLKPTVKNGEIGYRFSPGPFLKAYVEAWNNPAEPVWFVIEELNRAPAAAVFGELFLLLDRADDGSSEYTVDYPSPECQEWIQDQIAGSITDRPEKLKLPSNLTIACTLNSADQGVYPLDTAFRRRWTQHYVPLDYSVGPDRQVRLIGADSHPIVVHWRSFTKQINNLMEKSGIREDRLLGPWFVAEHEFTVNKSIPEKVLVYLWDDVFRNHEKSLVFSYGGSSYGGLAKAIEVDKRVFSDELLSALSGEKDD